MAGIGNPIFLFLNNASSTSVQTGTALTHIPRTTVWDIIEQGRDFLGADASGDTDRTVHRAVQAALRELVNSHQWLYYYNHGRIQARGFVTDGTIQFQVSSGSVPNLVTLTPSVGTGWPVWANLGSLRTGSVTTNNLNNTGLGTVIYDVDYVIDSTHLVLKAGLAPIVDIVAGTSYTLFMDTYDLPTDFVNTDQGFADVSWGGMEYVHPNKWLQVNRYYQSYSNTPRFYTIMGSPKSPNRLCWRIFPFPDSDRTLDFVYKRRPRPVTRDSYTTGTVSTDSVGSPALVFGNGTAWTADMVGSVIRLSSTQALPTGWSGSNVYVMERNILQVNSATQLTVDDAANASYSNVGFRISDPVDVEETAMLDAYLRCVEKHVAMMKNMKDAPIRSSMYEQALLFAKDADARSFASRVAGVGGPYRQRLANMPRGPDVS
jgi:hypothetical protein